MTGPKSAVMRVGQMASLRNLAETVRRAEQEGRAGRQAEQVEIGG